MNTTENSNTEASKLSTYNVFWAPEGRKIATVQARSMKAAKRKAPMPYRKYLGEIYAEQA